MLGLHVPKNLIWRVVKGSLSELSSRGSLATARGPCRSRTFHGLAIGSHSSTRLDGLATAHGPCRSRTFHGLAIGTHSPTRPEGLAVCDMKELHFTNDFMSRSTEYQGMIAYCVPTIDLVDGMRPKGGSWVEATLPLKSSVHMRESMVSFIGKKVRYGKLFEVIDAIAADVSYKHIGVGENKETKDVTIVTACVDGMIAKSDIKSDEDLTIQAFMTYAGRSSMEIHVNLLQSDEIVASTQFIMVAQREGKSWAVPGLAAFSDEERVEHTKGRERAAQRKEKSASSLELKPPQPEEVGVMHSMYLLEKEASKSEKDHPRNIASKKYLYMKDSIVDSTYVMHKQQRNIHNKIFGGELMRIAFEMAFICARCYAGTDMCHFYAIDDISFLKPVNIGAIMDFVGKVIYSRGRYIVIQVDVWELSPDGHGRQSKTNQLTYIFEGNDDGTELPQVLPQRYEEMVLYVNGKRSFDSCFKDGYPK